MTTIKVTLPLCSEYDSAYSQFVTLEKAVINALVDVQDGSYVYTTPFTKVGSMKYGSMAGLEAAIQICFTYDAMAGVLELYGNDYISDQSTRILIRFVGTSKNWWQNTHTTANYSKVDNSDWPLASQLTPGLWESIKYQVREANTRFLNAAKAAGVFPVIRIRTPPPVLDSADELSKWLVMTGPDGTFLGTFDPLKTYPEGTTMENYLQSKFGGVVFFNKNENIANVIGSSKDPKISSLPWIELWERDYGMEDRCTSHNWASGKAFVCNDAKEKNRVGGHVVTGKTPMPVKAGSNSVYIIPICKTHNGNDNVYMRANVYTQGVWLKDYNK